MIPIEKNVPIPKKEKKYKYPFRNMEILDSFFIEVKERDERKRQYRLNRLQSDIVGSARSYRETNMNNFKVITRRSDKGIRVWRKS